MNQEPKSIDSTTESLWRTIGKGALVSGVYSALFLNLFNAVTTFGIPENISITKPTLPAQLEADIFDAVDPVAFVYAVTTLPGRSIGYVARKAID